MKNIVLLINHHHHMIHVVLQVVLFLLMMAVSAIVACVVIIALCFDNPHETAQYFIQDWLATLMKTHLTTAHAWTTALYHHAKKWIDFQQLKKNTLLFAGILVAWHAVLRSMVLAVMRNFSFTIGLAVPAVDILNAILLEDHDVFLQWFAVAEWVATVLLALYLVKQCIRYKSCSDEEKDEVTEPSTCDEEGSCTTESTCMPSMDWLDSQIYLKKDPNLAPLYKQLCSITSNEELSQVILQDLICVKEIAHNVMKNDLSEPSYSQMETRLRSLNKQWNVVTLHHNFMEDCVTLIDSSRLNQSLAFADSFRDKNAIYHNSSWQKRPEIISVCSKQNQNDKVWQYGMAYHRFHGRTRFISPQSTDGTTIRVAVAAMFPRRSVSSAAGASAHKTSRFIVHLYARVNIHAGSSGDLQQDSNINQHSLVQANLHHRKKIIQKLFAPRQ